MSGWIHALEEAIPAVIEAVEKVGKIKVPVATHAICWRNWMEQFTFLPGKDKGGFSFLQAEILPRPD